MKITKVNLLNFRNYDKLDITLNAGMNIFIGNNAQGKTNILESIVLLALTKSHRLGNEESLVKFGKSRAKIKGKVRQEKIIRELEIDLDSTGKSLFVNRTSMRKLSDYISNLNIISFTPDDLEIIKSSPSVRRNILNIQLSQLSKKYLNTYNEYNKLLKTRNEYLKVLLTNNIADRKYLDIITDRLIEKAIIIYRFRKEYVDHINKNISLIYKDIASDGNLFVEYSNNVEIFSYAEDELREVLSKTYLNNYKKELNYGVTLYGPHRDDLSFILDDKDLKIYGSQGQQRLAVICFKLSEISIFDEYCGTKPVLLFDDVLSELDIKKRNKLLKYISSDIQSIVTTTDLKNIQRKYLDDAFIFEVKAGKITRK